jgi:hypothetical protein
MSSDSASSTCDTNASDPRQQDHVFLSHAGQQKRNVVDHVRDRFVRDHPHLKVFVDEHTLEPGDRAMDRIWGACGSAFVREAPSSYVTQTPGVTLPKTYYISTLLDFWCSSCMLGYLCMHQLGIAYRSLQVPRP